MLKVWNKDGAEAAKINPGREAASMMVSLIEYGAREALLSLIEEINRHKTSAWGLVLIKRDMLKTMSNDSLILKLKPSLQDVTEARAFALENGDMYIAWLGMQKRVYSQLCMDIGSLLYKPETVANPASVIVYFDPQVMGNEITAMVKAGAEAPPSKPHRETLLESWRALLHESALQPSSHDVELFHEALLHRQERHQLEILVVEDQQLLRRLLHDMLRTDHHSVHSVATLQEGWKYYLEYAPHIAFLDIGLGEENGHTLAKAIKDIDPSSCVVMVTANNTSDEIEIARENHVNGFIGKPYSKQQISKVISKYMTDHNLSLGRHKSA
jgi:CheY-like chemotaxis protein